MKSAKLTIWPYGDGLLIKSVDGKRELGEVDYVHSPLTFTGRKTVITPAELREIADVLDNIYLYVDSLGGDKSLIGSKKLQK